MTYCPLRPYMLCPLYSFNNMDIDVTDFDEYRDEEEDRQAGFAFVRFFHASPNTPPVDIYIDDRKAVSNLVYASIAGYAALPSTFQKITVFPLGETREPLLTFTINPSKNSYRTIVIAGLSPNIQHRTYKDSDEFIPGNESHFRFVHMSPATPSLDVVTETGQTLFSSVTFGRVADYISLTPNIYRLRLRIAGTPNEVLGLPEITFRGSRAYTIYAIGLLGGTPPLAAVMVADGRR